LNTHYIIQPRTQALSSTLLAMKLHIITREWDQGESCHITLCPRHRLKLLCQVHQVAKALLDWLDHRIYKVFKARSPLDEFFRATRSEKQILAM
jgi:hypothetical protein